MFKTALCAGFILALSAGAGSAVPASGSAIPSIERDSNIVEVRHNKRHWKRQWKRNWKKRHWRRHHSPPRGWHRYHSRPWNWQHRGCVMFGPVWFCP